MHSLTLTRTHPDSDPNPTLTWIQPQLEAALAQVRAQKSLKCAKDEQVASFVTNLPSYASPEQAAKAMLHPDAYAKCVDGVIQGHDLLDLLQPVQGNDAIYTFPLLKEEFCDALVSEAERMHGHVDPVLAQQLHPSGSLVPVLDDMQLGWLNDFLLHQIVAPVAEAVFHEDCVGGPLDWRHGYIVGYGDNAAPAVQRSSLIAHTDDSEVTLNIALGREFDGGQLRFRGVRGSMAEMQGAEQWVPRKGHACIHLGRRGPLLLLLTHPGPHRPTLNHVVQIGTRVAAWLTSLSTLTGAVI